jgi:glycerol-3-phosphate dehydrogenase subunit C
MSQEGNLQAPTRHPLDWKNPDFYNEQKLDAELERVFDICHGCRRCVSLCNAFPTLFDLIDEAKTGELDSVDHKDFGKVVDQCYLCDVCYMTKCPYTPPHPWNLDFPHLMLRAKVVKFKQSGANFRDRLLSSTDALGKLASIPVVVQVVNAVNKNETTRKLMDSHLGIHAKRDLPEYNSAKFRSNAAKSPDFAVKDGQRTKGKVAIYSTCYVNYNEPGIGHDLIKLLKHNEIPYVLVEKEACCGMPKLELGDLEAVDVNKNINIPGLAKLAEAGYAILSPVPSCTLMFKQEIPLMYPSENAVLAVKSAFFDPFEYFALRQKDGLLKNDFKVPLGNVSYHIPCHSRVQNVGQKTREILQLVPQTVVNTVERCAGHDGTWGVKKEYYEVSMKIGKPVFRAMASMPRAPDAAPDAPPVPPDYISSDCAIAARHILQGMRENQGSAVSAQKLHPLTLLSLAYGLN